MTSSPTVAASTTSSRCPPRRPSETSRSLRSSPIQPPASGSSASNAEHVATGVGSRHTPVTDASSGCATISAVTADGALHMFERLFGSGTMDPAIAERIPPGQYKTEKFPVLHYGSVPNTDLAKWDFKVFGEVDNPITLTWDQFKALPRKTVHTDIHCVTRRTKLDTDWER